jgi:hypothetical protein
MPKQDETPKRLRRLGDGSAELAYRAYPGDGTVFVFAPGTPAKLVAEVSKIRSNRGPEFEIPTPKGFRQFKAYADEILAEAVAFYNDVTPTGTASYFQPPKEAS